MPLSVSVCRLWGFLLAHIHPACPWDQRLQFFAAYADRRIGTAAGREDMIKAAQGCVQVDRGPLWDGKRTDTADGMIGAAFHFISLQHLCLDVKGLLELVVVDLAVTGTDDDERLFLSHEGK